VCVCVAVIVYVLLLLLLLLCVAVQDEIKMTTGNASFPMAVKKGWLQMKTTFWVRRFWFVLDDKTLYWFKGAGDDAAVVDKLPLTDVFVVKDDKRRLLFRTLVAAGVYCFLCCLAFNFSSCWRRNVQTSVAERRWCHRARRSFSARRRRSRPARSTRCWRPPNGSFRAGSTCS
jgi:hypothetical protein